MLVTDSPTFYDLEAGQLFAGKAGRVLDATLSAAGLARSQIRIISLVPVRAPGDNYDAHDLRDVMWGIEEARKELRRLTRAKIYIAAGETALGFLTGLHGIGNWRGSQLSVDALRRHEPQSKEDYLPLANARVNDAVRAGTYVVPIHNPVQVAKQFAWHPWLILDLGKVKHLLEGAPYIRLREWYFNRLDKLAALADRLKHPREHSGIIAIDTESWPFYIVGIATEDEVHVFQWDESYRAALESILSSPFVIKVAHNLQHDWTFVLKRLGISVTLPWFDTMGGAHVLNNAMDKSLSPAIATRFTNWPYHKWMVDFDAMWYNGIDAAVTYDAYEPQLAELQRRGLYDVAKHDHGLLQPLLDMQWHGFKVDEAERQKASAELRVELDALTAELQHDVAPIIDSKLRRFVKPHLFEVERRCDHCGGGKTQAQHCWRCAGLEAQPKKKIDYRPLVCSDAEDQACEHDYKHMKASQLRELMPVCSVCGGTGKVKKRLEFNPESADQVADVLYRGLGIRPRKYKGVETVRVGQLEPLASNYPLVGKLVDYARKNADYETVERLSAGDDGRLHCVFDPFGTANGRVASKEGLVEKGTNAMNIPKKARRLVVPDEGYVFLYPDMSQVEARAIAATTRDKTLIEMFNDSGLDTHALVRDDMRKVGIREFSRDQAKRLEYASFYGGQAEQIAKELTDEAYRKGEGQPVTAEQTKLMMDTLLTGRFAGVRRWHENVEQQLLSSRKIRSITGREMYYLGDIYDPATKGIKNEIIKQAYAAEPQDVGAWVLGEGMMELWREHWQRIRGLIHVHDALLLMARIEDADEAAAILTRVLSREKWGVKFPAVVKQGRNWYEAS